MKLSSPDVGSSSMSIPAKDKEFSWESRVFELENALSEMVQVREQSLIHPCRSPECVSYRHHIIFYRGNFLHCLAEYGDQK